MLIEIIRVWAAGAIATALVFAFMLTYLFKQKTRDARYVFRWYAGLAPEYIIFWPWRAFLFPLYLWGRGRL